MTVATDIALNVDSYSVSATAYLSRAKRHLIGDKPEGLFYAAFELRCCVETRQAEYAEALAHFDAAKIQPWKVGETRKKN